MKGGMTMKRSKLFLQTSLWLLALLIALPIAAYAQGPKANREAFTQQELDQMLAPIALYSDSLLAQILMASTYPLEVVMADRWLKENKKSWNIDNYNYENHLKPAIGNKSLDSITPFDIEKIVLSF